MNQGAASSDLGADLALVATLFSLDPVGLGGIVVRAAPSPRRDRFCDLVRALRGPAPWIRIPLHITEDRLIGGLSLADTLSAGRLVMEQGVLARADGGVVILPMAERLEHRVTTAICAALDRGQLTLERDGLTALIACHLGVVALDEGSEEESAPDALLDRLAFRVDLCAQSSHAAADEEPVSSRCIEGRALLPNVSVGEEVIDAICRAAQLLGVDSLRAPLLTVAAARAHAALSGRARAEEEDIVVAARLVLGPRATRIPQAAEQEKDEQAPSPQPPPVDEREAASDSSAEAGDEEERAVPSGSLDEMVVAAAKSGIPAGLLDTLILARAPRSSPRSEGRAGAARASTSGGRPAGTRAAVPQPGERLNLVETLRAAAPWQKMRRHARLQNGCATSKRIEVRKEDFRLTRFQQATETSVIFSVDASGSSALQRLGEAKGAVEQVLGDCYARRDHVALIAFRGTSATLLLPPTRSLARVRRCLADLAGGGTTPLSLGIDAAFALALDARKRGRTAVMVLMTDGRANIARDGGADGPAALADAMLSAQKVRAARISTLFLDTAPRPRPQARALAAEMGARYLPLPYLDAASISRHVQSIAMCGS